ncbi:MAG: hypothetical protein A3F09_05615 [Chlamydiae bacterium RIFCSPHIGHO2_12_FULL_49_11]|nr:MAG: hypothetical protein A3F09_05615 [Chlamydiae bacterium RIFCSPHIGHO2_12_FULL_49_11]
MGFLCITILGCLSPLLNLVRKKPVEFSFVVWVMMVVIFCGKYAVSGSVSSTLAWYRDFFSLALFAVAGCICLIRFLQLKRKRELVLSLFSFLLFVMRFFTPALASWIVR